MPITLDELLSIEPRQPTPTQEVRSFMDLPLPEPPRQTRYFGGQTMRSRVDPFQMQDRMRQQGMEMQAEQEARQLTQMLNGIDPTAPTAVQDRFSAVASNPLGASSQMGQAVLRAFDAGLRATGQQTPTFRDDSQELLDRLYEVGATDEEIAEILQGGMLNRGAAMRRIGMGRPREQREANVDRINEIEKRIKLLNDPLLGSRFNDAERVAMLDQLANQLREELGGAAVPAPMSGGGSPATAPTAVPQMTPEELEELAIKMMEKF
jgi:hypothetical protein